MDDLYGSQATRQRTIRGTKILLVEDNSDHRDLIQRVLKACMPEVELLLTATGEEALSQLDACREAGQRLPRLILLDLYMPQRDDGWHLLQTLKGPDSLYRLIPVTVLSQSSQSDDIQTSYDLGANSYITKPVSYPQWVSYFQTLEQYWLNTVTLPHW